MARLTAGWPHNPMLRVVWEVRRACDRTSRRWGSAGPALVVALALLLAVLWVREAQKERWSRANDQLASLAERIPPVPPPAQSDARTRLQAFDRHLLPHEELATALQDLIALAESNGLVLAHGTYRPQPETQGGYLRYRMTLPVSGAPDAVHRFMMTALGRQRNLSLESVHFKRERNGSRHVEARIQWALLARLPSGPATREGDRASQ